MFLQSYLVVLNGLFVLVFTNRDAASKRFKAKRYYLPKEIIDNYSVIINEKNFCDQAINSDKKRYEENRNLTMGQGEDYTIGCLLDYEYVKNYYRLIAVVLEKKNYMQMPKQFNK